MVVDISDPKFDVKAMFLEFYSYRPAPFETFSVMHWLRLRYVGWDVGSNELKESTDILIEAWILSGYVTRKRTEEGDFISKYHRGTGGPRSLGET